MPTTAGVAAPTATSPSTAGRTTAPRQSRTGFTLRTAGPGSISPVRIFGPAEIHLHGAWPADFQAGPLQVLDHQHPRRFVVVGAIDAHAVHAALQELADEGVVTGRLTGHRDHDPDRPGRGWRTEQRGSVPGQQLGTFGEVGDSRRAS